MGVWGCMGMGMGALLWLFFFLDSTYVLSLGKGIEKCRGYDLGKSPGRSVAVIVNIEKIITWPLTNF